MLENAIIRAEKINKSFSGVQVLKDVDFSLVPGKVNALIGENGAGKSTLIKILTGVHSPDSGNIYLEGKAVHIMDPLMAQQLGITAIYQELIFLEYQTVAENLFLGQFPSSANMPFKINWKKLYEDSKKILRNVELDIDPNTYMHKLSVAQKQLVMIAKALTRNVKVLILDEPTAPLSDHETEILFGIIKKLKEQGIAICYISHRLPELKEIGDTITVLKDGCNVGIVCKNTCQDDLIQMMTGRQASERFPEVNFAIGMPVLNVTNLTKKGVFENISFTLNKGEILGIAGLAGARRSEIFMSIFGVIPYDDGRIEINGVPTRIKSPVDAMEQGIFMTPSERKSEGLIGEMCVSDNLTISCLKKLTKIGILQKKQEEDVVKQYVSKFSIKLSSLKQNIMTLSGGNQQKVILAKALTTGANILILDEPTRGIDVGTKMEIYKLLNTLVQEGYSIVLISSELPELLGLCNRIIVIKEGKITGEILSDEATEEKVLGYAF